MIAVIDYGAGNIRSVASALTALQQKFEVVPEPVRNIEFKALLIPGVGHFGYAMENLVSSGLSEWITEFSQSGGGVLGICLGMQLLFESSDEAPNASGLSLIAGKVVSSPSTESKSRAWIGWNEVTSNISDELNGDFYFAHSFECAPRDSSAVIATSFQMERPVVAGVRTGNIMGLQFHPEKSSTQGLRVLEWSLQSLRDSEFPNDFRSH